MRLLGPISSCISVLTDVFPGTKRKSSDCGQGIHARNQKGKSQQSPTRAPDAEQDTAQQTNSST